MLVLLANYRTWVGTRNPPIFSQLVKSEGDLGTPKLEAGVWGEGNHVEDLLLICDWHQVPRLGPNFTGYFRYQTLKFGGSQVTLTSDQLDKNLGVPSTHYRRHKSFLNKRIHFVSLRLKKRTVANLREMFNIIV